MFKVVADQLKISEGWVRCGHCADVFDATLYLQPWTPQEADDNASSTVDEVVPLPEPVPQLASRPDEQGVETPADLADDPISPVEQRQSPGLDDEHALETLPPPEGWDKAELDEVESDFHGELERFAAGLGRLNASHVANIQADNADANASVEVPPPARTAAAIPEAPAPRELDDESKDAADGPQDAPVPEPEPGFVRQARRQAFWRTPGMRVALSLAALVLAALFAVQWAVHERDRLAAWRPGLQSLLQQVCAPLNCTLAPVRRIDAIVIDSTSLVNRLGNFYSFDLVLKNTASLALAVPALELSITDIGGSVISRRIFLPTEWPDAPPVLPALGSVTVHFRLALSTGEATPMAGYNALIFYP